MKTVINKNTGEVLYCFFDFCEISENELIIDFVATATHYDFDKNLFYNKMQNDI